MFTREHEDAGTPDRDDAGLVDAGPADAASDGGTGDVGADGGFSYTPSGAVWVQLEDGLVARVDLATREVSYPLGPFTPNGAVASDGEQLLLVTDVQYLEGPGSGYGRLVGYRPEDGSVTLYGIVPWGPSTMATDGEHVAIVGKEGETVTVAPLEYNAETVNLGVVMAPEYGPDGLLYYSDDESTKRAADGVVLFPLVCGGLDYRPPPHDDWTCAHRYGRWVVEVASDGTQTPLYSGDRNFFYSVTRFDDGTFVAVGRDCFVATDAPLAEGTHVHCPAQFAVHQGAVYVGQANGGLLEITDQGPIQRLGFARDPGGISLADGRIAIGGTYWEEVRILRRDLSHPKYTPEYDEPFDIALQDDETLWIADLDGIHRYLSSPEESQLLYPSHHVEAIAVGETRLFVAHDTAGLLSFDLQSPDLPVVLSDESAQLVAACGDVAVFVGRSPSTLYEWNGSTRVLDPDVGEITGLGCHDGQILLARSDGSLAARPLERPDVEVEITTFELPVWHLAGEPMP